MPANGANTITPFIGASLDFGTDVVLFVITPESVRAVEAPSGKGGGIKFEMQMATARRTAGEAIRLIGIYRKGNDTPAHLQDHRYADFRDDSRYSENLAMLVADLLGGTGPPPVGAPNIESRLVGSNPDTIHGFDAFRFSSVSTSSNPPEYSEAYVTIEISTPATIFDLSAASWHPQVYVRPLKPVVQIPGGSRDRLQLRVQWASGDIRPEVLHDSLGRAFRNSRPRDPGPEWEPLYISFDTANKEVWAAVTYFKVSIHQRGFPEVSMIGAPAPFDWIPQMGHEPQ